MIDGIEAYYRRIADSMVETIPETWSSASFEAIFYAGGNSVYEAEYLRNRDGKARGFQPASDGSRAFRELRRAFKEAGKPLWGKARFGLRPDGRFEMKWNYDDCDREGNIPFDEESELRRHEERRRRLSQ